MPGRCEARCFPARSLIRAIDPYRSWNWIAVSIRQRRKERARLMWPAPDSAFAHAHCYSALCLALAGLLHQLVLPSCCSLAHSCALRRDWPRCDHQLHFSGSRALRHRSSITALCTLLAFTLPRLLPRALPLHSAVPTHRQQARPPHQQTKSPFRHSASPDRSSTVSPLSACPLPLRSRRACCRSSPRSSHFNFQPAASRLTPC
jgi:hypothetical protein